MLLFSSGVLDDDAGDTLVNVNIIDDERVEKNLKNLRDTKAGGYNPYDEEIDPLTGDLSRKGKVSLKLFFSPNHLTSNFVRNGHNC